MISSGMLPYFFKAAENRYSMYFSVFIMTILLMKAFIHKSQKMNLIRVQSKALVLYGAAGI